MNQKLTKWGQKATKEEAIIEQIVLEEARTKAAYSPHIPALSELVAELFQYRGQH